MMAVESQRGSVRLEEVAHGGAGAGEHEDGKRGLSDDEDGAGSRPARCRAAGAGGLDHLADVGTGKLQGGREAGEDSNDDRDGGAEEKNRHVERDHDFVGDGVLGDQAGDEPYGAIGKGHSQRAAGDGQDHRLCEQLPHDAGAGGTQGEAGCELLQAGGSPGQHEDGDVAAADEKQERDGDKEQNQGALELAEYPVVQGLDLDAIAIAGQERWFRMADLLDEAGQFARRCLG